MADDPAPPPAPAPATPPAPVQQTLPPSRDDDDDDYPGVNATGKRLLIEARAQRRTLNQQIRDGQARSDAFEKELGALRAQTQSIGTLKAGLLRQAVAAAAAGRLADPQDAISLVDLKDITVGDDGTVDTKALQEKIDELIKSKPYLGAGSTASLTPRPLPGGGPAVQQPKGNHPLNDMIREAAGHQ